jgi:hypothetical protein
MKKVNYPILILILLGILAVVYISKFTSSKSENIKYISQAIEESNGLQISVEPNEISLKPGNQFKILVQFKNTSDSNLAIHKEPHLYSYSLLFDTQGICINGKSDGRFIDPGFESVEDFINLKPCEIYQAYLEITLFPPMYKKNNYKMHFSKDWIEYYVDPGKYLIQYSRYENEVKYLRENNQWKTFKEAIGSEQWSGVLVSKPITFIVQKY